MEENVIIKSKSNRAIIFIAAFVIGIAAITFCYNLIQYQETVKLINAKEGVADALEELGHHSDARSYQRNVTKTKTKATIQMCAIIAAISIMVVSIIIILFTAKTKLVITNKRACGIAGLGKRMDIPIDSISSIGTGIFQSVIIASSSGRIVFAGLSNYNELHNVVSNLLIQRQKNGTTSNNNIAAELTKFKELLDSGIISQDEFDAKKKQFLGL